MKQELDRIKGDVETMQRAMGLAPMAREWIHWLKRDRWVGLLWCLPGLVEIAGALLPVDHKQKHWGLVADQWTGIFTALALAIVAAYGTWKQMGRDGRPEAVARETKRLYGCGPEGTRFSLVLAAQVALFFLWSRQHHLSFEGFFTGIFIFMGSACLIGAVVMKIWQGLAFAIPFLLYGFLYPTVKNSYPLDHVSLGIMFLAIALIFSFIFTRGKSGTQKRKMNPIDFNGLDTAVHGPIRLGIMTALQVDGPLDFTTLKKRLETVDGSLNLHLGKLEENGYIAGKKAFVALRPKTTYRITPTGKKALANYLKSMKGLIEYLEKSGGNLSD